MRYQLFFQYTTRLDEQALIDRFMGYRRVTVGYRRVTAVRKRS